MRKIIYALLAVGGLAAVSSTPAEAWGGCGPGWRPTPYGCRPIHHRYWGPRYYGGPAFFVGPGYGWGPRWHHHHWRRHYW